MSKVQSMWMQASLALVAAAAAAMALAQERFESR